MVEDMLIDAEQVIAVDMYELIAADAFEVEVFMAASVADILIASAGFFVDDIFSDKSLSDEFIEPAVDSSNADRRAFSSKIGADVLDAHMLVLVLNEVINEFFLLFGIITRISFHFSSRIENDIQFQYYSIFIVFCQAHCRE